MSSNFEQHKIGYFNDRNSEFVVEEANQLKPQDNFLFNNKVFSYVTHTGDGYFAYVDKDDYTTEGIKKGSCGRAVYIRDNDTGAFFTVGWSPVLKEYEYFEATIGLNYTSIINVTDGIQCIWTIFVPKNDAPVEMWKVTVQTTEKRNLSVIFYSEMVVFSSYPTYGDYFYCHNDFDAKSGVMHQINKAPILKDKINAATCKASRMPDSYTCSKADFLGGYRGFEHPISMEQRHLSNTSGSNEVYCCAFQFDLEIDAEKEETIHQILVLHNDQEDISQYLSFNNCFEELFVQTKEQQKRLFSAYEIHTGDEELDRITNIWIKQMIAFGKTHCRWGIKGFRDVVQHGMGYSYLDAEAVREILIKCMKHQYSNGFAVRSFPAIHSDSAMEYNDSSTWLVYTVTEYIKESGDLAFLEEEIPFLDQGAATVLERLDLIVNSVYRDRGQRGLVRMRGGDWNDSLTHVGTKGRGESVWLSMFLAKALLIMSELFTFLNKDCSRYDEMYQQLKKSINENAWDGEWYLCAINDVDEKIGSKESEQAKIFLNMQSWALISGVADQEKIDIILRSVEKYLKTEYGYLLNNPAYTKLDENIGRLSAIEPGTLENATSYTHGNAFYIYGLLCCGKGDAAYDLLKKINPQSKYLENLPIVPYVYANCYYGPDYIKCPGKMEHSWITGSVNWLTQDILDFMLGVRRTYNGLSIHPVLPASFKDVSVNRRYRGCEYTVHIHHEGNHVKNITVNGTEHPIKEVLPCVQGEKMNVEVYMM